MEVEMLAKPTKDPTQATKTGAKKKKVSYERYVEEEEEDNYFDARDEEDSCAPTSKRSTARRWT